MSILPVKCFTCGKEISSYYRRYESDVRKEKLGEVNKMKILYLSVENSKKSIEGKVLDNLNITKNCCRRHFLTHVEIH